jgi:hypothetical protein
VFLIDEYFVDEDAAEAGEVGVGDDAGEDVGKVGDGQEDCADMVGKDDGEVHGPTLLVPFLLFPK